MPTVSTNQTDIFYETFGNPMDPAVILIMGLGGQMIAWDDDWCSMLVDHGLFVVRFDNRDVGLSTIFEDSDLDLSEAIGNALAGLEIDVPYTLSDMAADVIGLMDHLDVERAHLVGVSMGGMIAQTVAAQHPAKAASLTSIMSSTGSSAVGQPTPEAVAVLFERPPSDRVGAVETSVHAQRVLSSPSYFDENEARAKAKASYERSFHPDGAGRQLAAIYAAGNRTAQLAQISTPTLVIHGDQDPLIDPSGGRHTAETIPGAQLLILNDMGHDLPRPLWPQLLAAIVGHISESSKF